MTNKTQIALRLKPSLIKQLDDIRPYTRFQTRTEFIETALTKYYSYVKHTIEQENTACLAADEENVALEEF